MSDDGGRAALREWFEAACDLPEDEWEEFLTDGCHDAALRAEVLDLLRRDRRGALPLDASLLGPDEQDALAALAAEPPLPDAIGDYRVLGVIGRGSMGTVYEAERRDGGRVALKVLRAALPSDALRHRFRREAEALARLDHPYVAGVHEWGTAKVGVSTLPFIAMELVPGRPIDRHCDELRLDTPARLELLARVGEGVAHAHGRGVVHRDLKPGNVLVDDAGCPRVLDFGVARTGAADRRASSLRTAAGQLLGTLQYMSPEQTLGDPARVDARCDVYALGVMGYELLVGRPPYDVARCPLTEALRRVQHEEPPALGALDGNLRGELDVVFARALAKDPDDRYPTVQALVDDLRALIAGDPIHARAPRLLDQWRRVARRNPRLVRVAAAFAAVLLLGIAGTTWGWREAVRGRHTVTELLEERTAEAARTEQARNELAVAYAESERIVTFLEDLFHALDGAPAHAALDLRDVLDLADERLGERFDEQPALAARLHRMLGGAWQGAADRERALAHYDAVLRLLGEAPDDGRVQDALVQKAMVLLDDGRFDDALECVAAVLPRLSTEDRRLAVRTARVHARTLERLGDWSAAEVVLRDQLDEDGRVPGVDVALDEALRVDLAHLAGLRGDIDRAESALVPILAERRRRLGDDHLDTLEVVSRLAEIYVRARRWDEAEALLVERCAGLSARLGPDHPQTLHARGRRAFLLVEAGRSAEIIDELDDLVEVSRRELGERHPRTASLLCTLSVAADGVGRADALSLMEEALALGRQALGERHPDLLAPLGNLGVARLQQGNALAARALLEEARAIVVANPSVPVAEALLVDVNLAGVLMTNGLVEEAEAVVRRALPHAELVLGARHPQTITFTHYLGELCRWSGQWEEAEQLYMRILDMELGWDHENTLAAAVGLGVVLVKTGREAQGEPFLRAAQQEVTQRRGEAHVLVKVCRDALGEMTVREVRGPSERDP